MFIYLFIHYKHNLKIFAILCKSFANQCLEALGFLWFLSFVSLWVENGKSLKHLGTKRGSKARSVGRSVENPYKLSPLLCASRKPDTEDRVQFR